MYLVTVAYNVRRGYAFLTYGETALLSAQDVVVILLIFLYGSSGPSSRWPLGAAIFPAVTAALVYALADEALIPTEWLEATVAASPTVLVASRLPQIYSNYANGSTGQLSAVAVFMFFAGSLTRVFTTLKEVDDPIILRGFIIGAAVNFVLSAQMVYYWNAPAKPATAKPAGATKSGAAAAGTSKAAASPSAAKRSNKAD